MNISKRIFIRYSLSLAAPTALVEYASAQTSYPNKPIHLIVPFAPGQVTDWLARFIGEQMASELKQPVLVENKAGLNGTIGNAYAVTQPADGYTLVITSNGTHAAAPSLFKKLGYDPIKSFTQIGSLMSLPWMLMVKPDFPAKNFEEFLSYARANPGKLNIGYGSSSSQLCIHLLRTLGKVDILSIPYKGLGQTVVDVRAGLLQATFLDMGSAMAQHTQGGLRGIAVTSPSRSSIIPTVPAISETLPGYAMTSWLALGAPSGTPSSVTSQLYTVLSKILSKPENKQKIAAYGGDVVMLNGDQVTALIQSESPMWAKFARESGIQPE
ncbi:MAG: tripartite tricarboxylate transporter substrate binding protein [Betaproteobacteria bacterium]